MSQSSGVEDEIEQKEAVIDATESDTTDEAAGSATPLKIVEAPDNEDSAAKPVDESSKKFLDSLVAAVQTENLQALEPESGNVPTEPAVFTLDESESVKKKIRELSEQQQTIIMACLSFTLFAIQQATSWLPTTGVILLACGLILLTKYTRLSNSCKIEGQAEGIRFSLLDALGKSSFFLPRQKIQSIRQLSDSFELVVESDVLNAAQKLVFRSLLRKEHSVPSHNNANRNLPAQTDAATVVRIPLAGLRNEAEKDRLTAFLQSMLAADQDLQVPVQQSSSSVAIDDGTTRVDYNPNKVAKDAAAKWMRKNNWKVSIMLFIVGMITTLTVGISNTFVVFMIAGLVCFLAAMHERERPTFIGFAPEGISFIWNRKSGETRSACIPWSSVSHVSSFCSTGRKLFDTMIDIRLLPETLTPAQRLMYGWMMPEYFDRSNPLKLRLRAGGLESGEARHNLLDALRKYLPADRVDPEVYKVLNPTDPESYTTLWLQTLGNAPRRFSEGHLPPGYQLDNGRYEVVSTLGAGGQATAYLANERWKEGDQECSRQIVLKEFILPSHAGAELSARSLEHIRREHELIKRIHNSQVVEYYGLFVEDHRAYLILEHVDGPSLRQLVEREGPVSPERGLELAEQMAEILTHLHSQSPPVVHRDFTPENLLLGKDGKLKLIDFNVAQELETSATRTIVGKHSYIPPEQFRGKPVPQSDIYAMGAGLYFLLTGEEPDPISVAHPILKRPEVGGEIDELVSRATQGDLNKRYKRAEDLREAIQKIRHPVSNELQDLSAPEKPSSDNIDAPVKEDTESTLH